MRGALAGDKIYPTDLAGVGERVVISRRCPDCQHCDVVLTTRLPAMVWFARNVREREEMAALCDALADGLPFEFDLTRRGHPEAERNRHSSSPPTPRSDGRALSGELLMRSPSNDLAAEGVAPASRRIAPLAQPDHEPRIAAEEARRSLVRTDDSCLGHVLCPAGGVGGGGRAAMEKPGSAKARSRSGCRTVTLRSGWLPDSSRSDPPRPDEFHAWLSAKLDEAGPAICLEDRT